MLTLKRPNRTRLNDVLVAQVVVRGATTVITAPSGWTLVRSDSDGSLIVAALYVKTAGATEPGNYRWNFNTAQEASGGIVAYSGVNPTSPVDATSGQANPATITVTAPSLTTNVANDELLFLAAVSTATTVSPPPGMVQRWGTASTSLTASALDDQSLSAAGVTGSRVGTSGSAGSTNIGQLVALRPASAGAAAASPSVGTLALDSGSSPTAVQAGKFTALRQDIPAGTGGVDPADFVHEAPLVREERLNTPAAVTSFYCQVLRGGNTLVVNETGFDWSVDSVDR